jgi:hypothetical protein
MIMEPALCFKSFINFLIYRWLCPPKIEPHAQSVSKPLFLVMTHISSVLYSQAVHTRSPAKLALYLFRSYALVATPILHSHMHTPHHFHTDTLTSLDARTNIRIRRTNIYICTHKQLATYARTVLCDILRAQYHY